MNVDTVTVQDEYDWNLLDDLDKLEVVEASELQEDGLAFHAFRFRNPDQ